MTQEIEANVDAIPAIEIPVQPVDKKGKPVGEKYIITSEDGVIDFATSCSFRGSFCY